jgi:hypothetical protein
LLSKPIVPGLRKKWFLRWRKCISGDAKGVAAGTIAAVVPTVNQHVVGQDDGSQVQVGMDPCWGRQLRRATGETKLGCQAWILDFFVESLMQITSTR